jgi:hypothetical protein
MQNNNKRKRNSTNGEEQERIPGKERNVCSEWHPTNNNNKSTKSSTIGQQQITEQHHR